MKKVTIYWSTKDRDKIARIIERFHLPNHTTINRETTAEIQEEDLQLLHETEKRGFIQIRHKNNQ